MEDFTETYTTGGRDLRDPKSLLVRSGIRSRDYEQTTPESGDIQWFKMKMSTCHSLKQLARVSIVAIMILIVLLVIINIAAIIDSVYVIKNGGKANFTQYLGGTANQVRGDRDDKSLAEMALLAATQASTPQTFVSRERLSTPEEEMMKQIKKKV